MLSENLESLRGRLAQYKHTGMELAPEAVIAVCAVLEAAIEDARELESRTVPMSERIDEFPENVVRIAAILDRKGVHVGPRPAGDGPGDAA